MITMRILCHRENYQKAPKRRNDSKLNIDWGIKNPIVSEKDKLANSFVNCNSGF